MKSTLSAALGSVLVLGAIAATPGCGDAPEDSVEQTTESSTTLTTFISAQRVLWGTNCIDSSHGYRDVTAVANWGLVTQAFLHPGNLVPAYGDPHIGCDKNIIINYQCASAYAGTLIDPAEANNRNSAMMYCSNLPGSSNTKGTIIIDDAEYGLPAAHHINVMGGVNGVAAHCNGVQACRGFFEYKLWKDPNPGDDKPLVIEWHCSKNSTPKTLTVPAEANHKFYELTCN